MHRWLHHALKTLNSTQTQNTRAKLIAMPRRHAWTLKALRALLACLCLLLAFPAAPASEPAARPIAAALATAATVAVAPDISQARTQERAGLAQRVARPRAEAHRAGTARNGRRLYLEKRALLC